MAKLPVKKVATKKATPIKKSSATKKATPKKAAAKKIVKIPLTEKQEEHRTHDLTT